MLMIRKVELQNFCQHEYLSLEFANGLTGIFGRNGAGKSNLAHAVKGAFTGAFRGHPDGTAGWIRQNQDGPCYVEVQGLLAGKEFRVRRDITNEKVHHRLWFGEQSLVGLGEVEEWFRQASGISTQVMSDFLFVRQKDFFEFLESPDGDRSKKFATLCGTTEFESLRKTYDKLLTQDRLLFEANAKVSLELLRESLESVQKTRERFETQKEELHRKGKELGDANDWERRWNEANVRLREIDAWESSLARAETAWNMMTDRYAKSQQEHQELLRTTRSLEEKFSTVHEQELQIKTCLDHFLAGRRRDQVAADLNAVLEMIKRKKELNTLITQQKEQLRQLPAPKPVDEEKVRLAEAERSDLDRLIAVHDRDLAAIRKLLETVTQFQDEETKDRSCPLCGADAEHWTQNFQTLQERGHDLQMSRNKADRHRKKLTDWLDEAAQHRRCHEDAMKERHALVRDLERNEREWHALDPPDRDAETELTRLNQWEESLRDLSRNARLLDESLHREKERLVQKQEELEQLGRDKDTLTAEWRSLHPEDREAFRQEAAEWTNRIPQVQERLHLIREWEKQRAGLEGEGRELVRQQNDLESKIAEQERLRESAGPLTAWFGTCGRAIDWLRKDGLPRLVHRSILRQLTHVVNEELTCFDRPFSVTVNDDLTFTALFGDGRRIHSKILSNGQKIMLALSFWSAINRTFAKNLGIMIFDEPADCLDPENTLLFYAILEKWKTMLHRRGQQVAIITLDEGMTELFDTVYRIGESPLAAGTPVAAS
jgi:DNA repair exonuclease SbcCD ATPase subunit